MQTLGFTADECKEFFINCVRQLQHWRKIKTSTAENWTKYVITICRKLNNNPDVKIKGLPGQFFCVEMLSEPEQFQNILQHSETNANGREGGLSNTTVANYMQMITFIMKNIEICTDIEEIVEYEAFKPKNIRRWEMAWGALKVDATNSRHYEYTNKIEAAKGEWGKAMQKAKDAYLKNPNHIHTIYTYLLLLTYNTLCARNDYAECMIYPRGSVIPLELKNTTNYVDLNTYTIHVNDTKNKFEIGTNAYKTYQELSEEFLSVLARSLRVQPRAYLFLTDGGGTITDHKFSDFIKDHLGDLFTYKDEKGNEKQLITGCDMIRHLFAQHYYRVGRDIQLGEKHVTEEESLGVKIFLDSIQKMLHSQTTHMENYITPYLDKHGVNIKQLDKITREYTITPKMSKYFSKDDKELTRLKYYCERFNNRLAKYGEDYTDRFGPEYLGLQKIHGTPVGQLTTKDVIDYIYEKKYDKDPQIKLAVENLLVLEEAYPNKTDLSNQLPLDCKLNFADVPETIEKLNEKFEKAKTLFKKFFKNYADGRLITNTQAAYSQVNPQIAFQTNYIEDNSTPEKPYNLRKNPKKNSKYITNGGAFVKKRVPKHHRVLYRLFF